MIKKIIRWINWRIERWAVLSRYEETKEKMNKSLWFWDNPEVFWGNQNRYHRLRKIYRKRSGYTDLTDYD